MDPYFLHKFIIFSLLIAQMLQTSIKYMGMFKLQGVVGAGVPGGHQLQY